MVQNVVLTVDIPILRSSFLFRFVCVVPRRLLVSSRVYDTFVRVGRVSTQSMK